jgi:hypothetical protein
MPTKLHTKAHSPQIIYPRSAYGKAKAYLTQCFGPTYHFLPLDTYTKYLWAPGDACTRDAITTYMHSKLATRSVLSHTDMNSEQWRARGEALGICRARWGAGRPDAALHELARSVLLSASDISTSPNYDLPDGVTVGMMERCIATSLAVIQSPFHEGLMVQVNQMEGSEAEELVNVDALLSECINVIDV